MKKKEKCGRKLICSLICSQKSLHFWVWVNLYQEKKRGETSSTLLWWLSCKVFVFILLTILYTVVCSKAFNSPPYELDLCGWVGGWVGEWVIVGGVNLMCNYLFYFWFFLIVYSTYNCMFGCKYFEININVSQIEWIWKGLRTDFIPKMSDLSQLIISISLE